MSVEINVTGEVGDVNSDGELDIRDLVGAKKYLVGLGNKSNFDINADGVSDLTDIVLLRKAILGLGYQVNEATTFSLTAGRTYDNPYIDKHHNFSLLLEGKYSFSKKWLKGWSIKGGYGMDLGKILGNNYGFQLTISKNGLFNL